MRRPPIAARRRLASAVALAAALLALPSLPSSAAEDYVALRHGMVDEQVRARRVADPAVLAAMERVPRHLFVPSVSIAEAYDDKPLPIGHGQTISQPYVVALMTELLEVDGDDKVLEIGTGSGYHTAVLAEVAGIVHTIEIIPQMAASASSRLRELGYDNIVFKTGDGYKGWPESAPFDAIILTAAPPRVPQPLIDQLRVGGKLVAPVGGSIQDLLVVTKTEDGIERRTVAPVRLMPMTGQVREGG